MPSRFLTTATRLQFTGTLNIPASGGAEVCRELSNGKRTPEVPRCLASR